MDDSGVIGEGWAEYGAVPRSRNASADIAKANGIWAKSLWTHKKFQGENLNFDIALMELEEEIQTRNYTQDILSKPPKDNTTVTAAGYGVLSKKT